MSERDDLAEQAFENLAYPPLSIKGDRIDRVTEQVEAGRS